MVSDFLQNPLKTMLRVIQANAIRAEIRCACAMTPIFQSPQYSTIAERPTGTNQNTESTMHKIYEKTTEVIKDAASSLKEAIKHPSEILGTRATNAQSAAGEEQMQQKSFKSSRDRDHAERIAEYAKRMDEETDRTTQTRHFSPTDKRSA